MEDNISMEKLVSAYIKIRDARDDIKRELEEKIKGLEAEMQTLSNTMLDTLKEQGIDSAKTPFGTAYRSVKSRYWTNDWEAMYDFIHENDAYELLEKRIHQSNMKQFLEEQPDLLPKGLNVDSEYTITVRRSK
jgi:rubrerythrin